MRRWPWSWVIWSRRLSPWSRPQWKFLMPNMGVYLIQSLFFKCFKVLKGETSLRRFNFKGLARVILQRTLLWKNTLMSLPEHSLSCLGFPFLSFFILYFPELLSQLVVDTLFFFNINKISHHGVIFFQIFPIYASCLLISNILIYWLTLIFSLLDLFYA